MSIFGVIVCCVLEQICVILKCLVFLYDGMLFFVVFIRFVFRLVQILLNGIGVGVLFMVLILLIIRFDGCMWIFMFFMLVGVWMVFLVQIECVLFLQNVRVIKFLVVNVLRIFWLIGLYIILWKWLMLWNRKGSEGIIDFGMILLKVVLLVCIMLMVLMCIWLMVFFFELSVLLLNILMEFLLLVVFLIFLFMNLMVMLVGQVLLCMLVIWKVCVCVVLFVKVVSSVVNSREV